MIDMKKLLLQVLKLVFIQALNGPESEGQH